MVGSKVNQQLVSSLSLISAVLNNFIAAKIVFRSHVKIGLHNEATAWTNSDPNFVWLQLFVEFFISPWPKKAAHSGKWPKLETRHCFQYFDKNKRQYRYRYLKSRSSYHSSSILTFTYYFTESYTQATTPSGSGSGSGEYEKQSTTTASVETSTAVTSDELIHFWGYVSSPSGDVIREPSGPDRCMVIGNEFANSSDFSWRSRNCSFKAFYVCERCMIDIVHSVCLHMQHGLKILKLYNL